MKQRGSASNTSCIPGLTSGFIFDSMSARSSACMVTREPSREAFVFVVTDWYKETHKVTISVEGNRLEKFADLKCTCTCFEFAPLTEWGSSCEHVLCGVEELIDPEAERHETVAFVWNEDRILGNAIAPGLFPEQRKHVITILRQTKADTVIEWLLEMSEDSSNLPCIAGLFLETDIITPPRKLKPHATSTTCIPGLTSAYIYEMVNAKLFTFTATRLPSIEQGVYVFSVSDWRAEIHTVKLAMKQDKLDRFSDLSCTCTCSDFAAMREWDSYCDHVLRGVDELIDPEAERHETAAWVWNEDRILGMELSPGLAPMQQQQQVKTLLRESNPAEITNRLLAMIESKRPNVDFVAKLYEFIAS